MSIMVATTFLDSHRILEHYFANEVRDLKKIKRLHFTELYERQPYKPDHFVKSEMDAFFGRDSIGAFLTASLDAVAEMLCFRGRQLYVETDRFEEWQETILSVSPLLVIAYKVHLAAKHEPMLDACELIRAHLSRTCLPSIYEPHLEDVCRNPRLIESHMHLNGATEPDIVWQDALRNPVQFYRHLRDSLRNDGVEEQYLQLGHFEPEDLYRLLQIAARLRDRLIDVIVCQSDLDPLPIHESLIEKQLYFSSQVHPMKIVEPIARLNPVQYEALFLFRAFACLDRGLGDRVVVQLHFYLLICSFFQKLLVQQKRQVGFDQFQKITKNELREYTEKHYADRFKQLQGMHGNHLSILEGRFATKPSRVKLEQLMAGIKKGYEMESTRDFDLKLVPHFIKDLDKRKPEDIVTFRDLELRLKNQRHLDVLLDALNQRASCRNASFAQEHIVGFDAASNELYASPEVFSPIFRKLAFLGYKNFTYHAGEDFVHLLSGIRAVYEAVQFLELVPGNRIGHATALGIDPKLWDKRIGKRLYVKRGEWLDNLIFTYHVCSQDAALSYIGRKLEQPIFQYFNELNKTGEYFPIPILVEAWMIRKYDPFVALGWREPGVFDGFAQQERERFQKASSKAREIYESYHTREYILKSNELILIDTDMPVSLEELCLIQSWVIKFLNKKGLAIEMMPSSNVRISHYKNYDEHHMVRWLGLTNSNDPRPIIVPGSDDTGIFMTNLRNEYAHIYRVAESKRSKDEARRIIVDLVDNSRVYSF